MGIKPLSEGKVDIGARVITVGRNAVRDGTAVQVLDTTLVAAKAGGDKA